MSDTSAIWSLGAMSGTSLDGIDAAMIKTDGHTVFEFGESAYRPYTDPERAVLISALGQWEGPEVDAAAEVVENAHAELLSKFDGADVIGFHGQTTVHRPDHAHTHQAGNGAILAEALECPVVWDFRTNDMALGGQGAPLAPFYHFALAKKIGAASPCAFLNIGGVANVTWIDPTAAAPEVPGALLAFDTGPGNARMDDLVAARLDQRMDEGGTLAARGSVDEAILEGMLALEPFFNKRPPKSLDRDDFSGWLEAVAELSDADALATLAAGTAGAVVKGIAQCPSPPSTVWVTGGGRKNPVLMELLDGLIEAQVVPVEEAGFNGDMLEAEAFAFLAVRVMRGLPTSAPGTTRVPAPVGGGQISRPGALKAAS